MGVEQITAACWAMLGGVFLEVLHWYGLRTNPKFPTYARRLKYWLATFGMVLFAGVIAVVVVETQQQMGSLNAFVLGFSLPAVPHKLGQFLPIPAVAGKKADAIDSLREFLIS